MNHLLALLFTFMMVPATGQPTKNRVVPNDPAKYRQLSAVHAGAGKMGFTQLIGRTELSTNFLYLHSGIIDPKSGIGHHFHHNIEEMYVLLTGEAEFTVNGRTSKIKAPAVVPCKMGDAHAIYNPTGEKLKWLNFAVSKVKGQADNFDLADARVGATLDPIPVFVSGRMERNTLKINNPAYLGNGVLYRRVLNSDIFRTNWNHVDHVVIPAGSTAGPRELDGIEEVYYVIKGSGSVALNNEKVAIKADDSFYGLLGEKATISNDGKEDLELLVIGVAASKPNTASLQTTPGKAKAMVLQMDFKVPKAESEAFEKMYNTVYVPAMKVQTGYLGSKLLRLYPENLAKEIQAEATTYNYQIQISFDTEENRRKWVASGQHQIAWPAASKIGKEFKWRGYDVMGADDQR
ncbi:cupin domain-containing protein [Adhaeribacter radiodurans]|uniref:Cupin domain-containing protein n=1 Tax=Adhaeribacter radiodurans TaxID=2745197 RepID=A0A7L7L2W9_9BACT|nr:cupin domain-containing protein [Adhaeribacter radiodurans]QMU27134.1 cupin domain-containing protein [Adhaeribacter radiodurans]